MAMTPEGKVKKAVRQQLDSIGGVFYFMPATGGYGKSGVPDFVGCYRGRFFGIECKANGNVPTALQIKRLGEIADAGGIALVIDEHNVHTVAEHLEKFYKQPEYLLGE